MLQQVLYNRDHRSHRRLKSVAGEVEQRGPTSQELRDNEVAAISDETVRILQANSKAEIAVLGCKRFPGMRLDRVQFYSEPPPSLGQNTRVLLTTEWVNHPDVERLSVDRFACRMRLRRLEIRKILLACGAHLIKPQTERAVDQTDYFDKSTAQSSVATDDVNLQIEKDPTMDTQVSGITLEPAESREVRLQKFFAMIHVHAAERGGWIGKRFWVRFRNVCGIDEDDKDADAPTLADRGVLERSAGAGHRIAKYRFVETKKDVTSADRTSAFVESKLADKEKLIAERRQHEEDIKTIDKKLADIADLEEAWTLIQAAMPS